MSMLSDGGSNGFPRLNKRGRRRNKTAHRVGVFIGTSAVVVTGLTFVIVATAVVAYGSIRLLEWWGWIERITM